jgi:hypothetical protein
LKNIKPEKLFLILFAEISDLPSLLIMLKSVYGNMRYQFLKN